jgi:hypothetical protein
VHGGYITWKYWLRRVRDAEIYSDEKPLVTSDGTQTPSTKESESGGRSRNLDKAENGGKPTQKRLPCRISIKVSGVEAFMYNRTPGYDAIIEAMQRKAGTTTEKEEDSDEDIEAENTRNGSTTSSTDAQEEKDGVFGKLRRAWDTDKSAATRVDTGLSAAPKTKKDDIPSFLRLLPIRLDCNKGAIVIGNENTSAVITAQFEKASGEVDASSCGPLDIYTQVFNLEFTHPVVHMKPNPDFKAPQLETAARLKQNADQGTPQDNTNAKSARPKNRLRFMGNLPSLSAWFSKSTDSIHTHPMANNGNNNNHFTPSWHFPGQERWKGLTRYLDKSSGDGHGEWDAVEYAKTTLIVDCPSIHVSFYWDNTGPVPSELDNSIYADPARPGDVNGSIPPNYGMDIKVFGGIINYGPWADRHRVVFQNIFFPGNYVDAVATPPLATGDLRILSVFKIYLSIEKDTVLRIPIREPSKDWKWKGKAHTLAGHDKQTNEKMKGKGKSRRKSMRAKQRDANVSGQNVRPFAWIDVKVAGNSSVNYIMDMVASDKGYQSKLDVDIVGAEISSSVNHGLLWRSGPVGLACDLSNPLGWNVLRKWNFNLQCRDLELYLLRDHLFLLTDLVTDWGSGPPSDYFTFVPFMYLLNVDFTDFRLYLNTSDSNIVNNPSDLDDNNFIIIRGQRLHGDVTIPLDRFRPLQNEISFDVKGHDLALEISMPSKNSLNTFVLSKDVAALGGLNLKGSYAYMTETSVMNTDRLFLDVHGDRFHLELYGWLVHHFMTIKDNYFGDFMHFKTLEEFQGIPSQSLAADATTPNGQALKISNDLDVILCVSADHTSILIPSNLYSAENNLRADLPYASADLRFTNYYMDLMVNFSPISLSLGTSVTSPGLPNDTSGQTEVFVDSLVIFGHRLFGLPPVEPTYVCNWDFDVGKITGECTSEFIEKAAGAARSFAFTFDDDENTLPINDPVVIHDATFLRLKTQDMHVWLHIANEAVLVSTGPISLHFNDLAGTTFSERLNVWIPDLTFGATDARSASRHRTRQGEKQIVETHAFLQTSISLNMLGRKLDFTEERNQQQAHMQEHDQRTNRTQYMFLDYPPSSHHQHARTNDEVRVPAMQYPEIPHPIFLYQPQDVESASSASSGYSSHSGSIRGRRPQNAPKHTASNGSFTQSIRSVHRYSGASIGASSQSRTLLASSPPRADSSGRHYTFPSEEERARRNLPPSSVALSSSLATPYFPLDQIEPDLSEVPSFPAIPFTIDEDDNDKFAFNDVSAKHLDESFHHTSFLISVEPGIRLHCTPEAIRCMSKLIELLQPQRPEDLLDEFQVKVMTKILDNQKRRDGQGSSLELGVRIPFTHIRFQNEYKSTTEDSGGKDQYDVILNQLKLASRIKKFPGERAGENSISLHTTLGSLGISVTERTRNGPSDDVAVQAEIRDLLVWMLTSKETSINVSFRAFETATASRKIDYLASLIHRTTLLGDELASHFEEAGAVQQVRLHYLAWYLTTMQERFPDPSFLTKASYALRAGSGHLRSHDSWKIISRFRYIWQCLPDDEKAKVLDICTQPSVSCPEGAEQKIIDMWDQWRTWDLSHVKKSLAMQYLFGSAPDEIIVPQASPLYVDIRSAGVKLIIDPGPKQSEAALHILVVNVAIIPPPEPEGLMLVGDGVPRKSTIVQINARESTVRVHWEICELVEVLINMFLKENLKGPKHHSIKSPIAPKPAKEDHDLQIVYVTDKAEVSLDTINLRSISKGQRFRFSVASADSKASGGGETITMMVALEQAGTELRSRSRMLLRSQFDHPSLYASHHEHRKGSTTPNEIKVAASSRMIKIQAEEDILGFIEVIDSVLRDEVAYFHQQTTALQQSFKDKPLSAKSDDKVTQLPNITVALFMDSYLFELALLQSLTWSIAGSSGRISVVPALGRDVTLRIDYDLEAHTHRMLSSSMAGSNVVSSLELPPVNGRLTITNTEKETRVSAYGIVETIELQASEIQALIATINKPEISTVIHAIQDDVGVLKTHFKEIFPNVRHSPVAESPKSLREIVFKVQMTLSGLNIVASAPGQNADSPTANLAIKLASVQLKATNIDSNHKIMVLSETIVHLQAFRVEMTLSDAETVRRCGNLTFGATFQATSKKDSEPARRIFRVRSSGLEVNIFADTASAVVDVMNHLQDKIKDLDLSKEKKYLRRLRHTKSRISHKRDKSIKSETVTEIESVSSGALFTSTYSLELLNIQVSWIVGTSIAPFPRTESEDLVFSFRRIELSTRKDDAARLMIEDMQLQMVAVSADKKVRSMNSALLPEVVFNVAYSSTKETRKVAFHAAGKSLDLRLDSRFILPANVIERSIALAGKKFRTASTNWNMTPTTSGAQRKNPFGNKRLASLLVDANFAGAVVHINGRDTAPAPGAKESRSQQKGRYSQFVGDGSKSSMVLRAPGVALKVEHKDDGQDPSLNVELRVDASSNTLYPTVVPILIDISDSIKELVREKDEEADTEKSPETPAKPAAKILEEENLITADPSAILGRTRLNLGLRICKQEFSLSCQPIARVAAIAKVGDIYVTVNSVKSQEHGHFFAASAAFEKLEATVQHVYSRESTFGFDVDSVVLSLMNTKHLNGTSGISAILKINPMGLQINARQLQDFLLFREIWVPPEIRGTSKPPTANANPSAEPHEFLMQRYQQVTAATAFPWNANVAITSIAVDLDLGQAIGKTSLHVHNLWASSKKSTDWEQNLCVGVEKVLVESTGRTSGFVELAGVKVRTSISWPSQAIGLRQTPLVQASLGFKQLRVKAGFDYQVFCIADICNFDFLMYNVRQQVEGARDRLVAILDGDKVHVFCTATSAAQGLALYQAIERLVQENQQAYKQSLKDIEKFLRRKSSTAQPFNRSVSQNTLAAKENKEPAFKTPISLHTDVVVTLRSINLGVYPSTFVDSQIFMLEASDTQARFAVALESGKIHSGLGMTLGQLSVALSSIPTPKQVTQVSDLTVEDVVASARSARGGTILRVPKVVATMHTWQVPRSNEIDYIFKSSLEGKVDVGWNYSRISYIRTMWGNHSRTLASRLGKPLPESNIKITSSTSATPNSSSHSNVRPTTPTTTSPDPTDTSPSSTITPSPQKPGAEGQEKITVLTSVPASKYVYTALEPPLIETPQLRDMGEATPPLEWIGLHRERLPNVTHQIVIVSLLEVAREVEDAYGRILGSG